MKEDNDERLARLEEAVRRTDDATRIAKTEVDRRLGDMNQLREQINRERGTYVDKDSYEKRHEEIRERLDRIQLNVSDYVQKGFYDEHHEEIRRRLGEVENRLATIEGGNLVKASQIGWLLAGLGLVITIVVVVVNLLVSGGP